MLCHIDLNCKDFIITKVKQKFNNNHDHPNRQMDAFNNFINTSKSTIMQKMLNFTDPEYYLIKYKPQLDADEAKFV